MDFNFGTTVFRDRRPLGADPYSPAKQRRVSDWDPELTIELPGAYLDPASSSAIANGTRAEILTSATLFLTNAAADVVSGDQIRVGGTKEDLASGVAYQVEARPAAPTNPFTGWQPVIEIPLTLVEG